MVIVVILLVIVFVTRSTAPVSAAGTVTITQIPTGLSSQIYYALAWTSDASGNVSGTTVPVGRGRVVQAKTIPGTGGVQPSNGYTVTLKDNDGVDRLGGIGAGQSNASAAILRPTETLFDAEAPTLELQVSGAGNAKQGTVIVVVAR